MAGVAEDGRSLVADDGTEHVLAGIVLRRDMVLPDDPPSPDEQRRIAGLIGDFGRGGVELAPLGPPDRYGRIPSMAFAGGRLLQAELVRLGLAVVRPEALDAPCATALMAIEAEARETGSGLWSDSKTILKATDDSSLLLRNGLYGLVEGRVVSVGYGSRMVFLDFGRDYRTDVTVMVETGLVSRLREAGFPVESLAGRSVRVRGVIEESGGPAIRLADPLALELLDGME